MTSASQHSKGWSGIAFCVLLVVSFVLMGNMPGMNATSDAVTAYIQGARMSLLWAGWLALPLSAFFLWFALGLAAWLRSAAPDDEGLPAYLRMAAIVVVSVALVQSAFITALALRPPANAGFEWVLNAMLFGPFGSMPLAVFVFAAAHSIRRHRSAPAWIAWLGYLTAFGQVWNTFGMFYKTGMIADNIIVYGVVVGLLPLFFILATSLCMLGVVGARRAAGSV